MAGIGGAVGVGVAAGIARRAAFAAVAAGAFLPLGGCAVSLFSKEVQPTQTEDARVAALEARMDAIDKASPPR